MFKVNPVAYWLQRNVEIWWNPASIWQFCLSRGRMSQCDKFSNWPQIGHIPGFWSFTGFWFRPKIIQLSTTKVYIYLVSTINKPSMSCGFGRYVTPTETNKSLSNQNHQNILAKPHQCLQHIIIILKSYIIAYVIWFIISPGDGFLLYH